MSQHHAVPPIRRSVTVRVPIEEAFRVFTEEIGSWWPLSAHFAGEEPAQAALMEGGVGGRVYERSRDGREADWGRILAWEPPHRLSFTWEVHRSEANTEVEVRFTPPGARGDPRRPRAPRLGAARRPRHRGPGELRRRVAGRARPLRPGRGRLKQLRVPRPRRDGRELQVPVASFYVSFAAGTTPHDVGPR